MAGNGEWSADEKIWRYYVNFYIFQYINAGFETCKALFSEDCFSILDTASTSFRLKIKEALHIG